MCTDQAFKLSKAHRKCCGSSMLVGKERHSSLYITLGARRLCSKRDSYQNALHDGQ